MIASPLCKRLQELFCAPGGYGGPALDGVGFWRLTVENFNRLTKLELDVSHVTDLDRVAAWCAINTKLEHLLLNFSHDSDPTRAITTIAEACTHLRTVDLFGGSLTASAFMSVVNHCPNVEKLEFDRISAKFGKVPNGNRYWEFLLDENEDFDLITGVLLLMDNTELPLRAASANYYVTAQFVKLIANRFGAALEKFSCDLDESDVQSTNLQHLFENCPNLHTVRLSGCTLQRCPVQLFHKLLDCCPLMKSLCIMASRTSLISDSLNRLDEAAIIAFLRGIPKDSNLDNIELVYMDLTDVVLDEIVSCFPMLKEIGFYDTRISAEAILRVIVQGKLKDAVVRISSSVGMTWIGARLREIGLGYLWRRMVAK